MSGWRISIAVVALSLLAGAPGLAQLEAVPPPTPVSPEVIIGAPTGPPISGEELEKRTAALASTMRCPVCQALSVEDSSTASAMAIRQEIKELLAAGYSEEKVLEYFETSYGEFILLAPKKKGLNWLVWLAPVAVLLIGAVLILGRVGRRRDTETDGAELGDADDIDDDLAAYAERVRREVAE